jgi:glycosyltransferase involved in cell wall biosynthesis
MTQSLLAFTPGFNRPSVDPELKVSLVVPTLNEARNLPLFCAELPEGLHELILVDGRSTDGTVDVARHLRPDVKVVLETASGKGAALQAGFAVATGDIVIMIDADGSTDPREIPLFIDKLVHGYDYVKGSRFAEGGGSSDITFLRKLGNDVLCGVVNKLWGVRYTDLCYGYAAFRRECLPLIDVDCSGFEVETLMNIRARTAGLRVAEVPSFERDRLNGNSNLQVIRDGLRILRTIVTEWARSRASRYVGGRS